MKARQRKRVVTPHVIKVLSVQPGDTVVIGVAELPNEFTMATIEKRLGTKVLFTSLDTTIAVLRKSN